MRRIAFLLAVVLFVTSLTAYAQNDGTSKDADGTKEELIAYLLSDKGFSDDERITRGRFLEAVITLMGRDALVNENGPYSDVEKDTYLSYCTFLASELNIIAKNPEFYPDAEIKYIDALTIMLRALGYGAIAESMGGYPNGNRTLANNLGLTRKTAETECLDKKTAYTLLFNMMDIEHLITHILN